ncbi:MAG: hypothetical protein C3F07_20215 [Anaerolineales bacterium]|nr:MAG: hypothetical protein C3F07_20215 [Anaerolineales bacterium]
MKKILVLVLVTVIAGACLPVPAPTDAAPTVDVQATIDSVVQTSLAQTLTAQPTATVAPVTDTATATLEPSVTTTPDTATPSSSPIPNLTTTPATATAGTINPGTSTATLPASGAPTLTPTLGVLTWGTLPPAVPSADITVYNKSKLQAYISLQNDPPQQVAILEYPVKKQVSIRAPIGYYIYVVWVGGRKISGDFSLHQGDMLTINIYKDKVVIKEN